MDRTRFAQTDGRKDRQSDSYIPPLNFVRGGYNEKTSLNIDVQVEIIMHVIGLSGFNIRYQV